MLACELQIKEFASCKVPGEQFVSQPFCEL